MRDCPFAGCNNKVAGSNFCCAKHWHSMGRDHRDRAFNAFRKYANAEISMDELIHEQSMIADDSSFGSDSISGETIYSTCDKCKSICFCVKHGLLGVILLDTEHFGITGEFVVIGGIAYSGPEVERRIVLAPALAKLRRHTCLATAAKVPYEDWKKGKSNAGNSPSNRRTG